MKKPRDTFTTDHMKFHKKLPDPRAYKTDNYGGSGLIKPKNLVNFKQSEEYIKSHFTDQAKRHSEVTPQVGKYKEIEKAMPLIKPSYRIS